MSLINTIAMWTIGIIVISIILSRVVIELKKIWNKTKDEWRK